VLLRAEGYQVSAASDAITAIIVAKQADPDLVILDLGLPGGDGFKVFDQLKAYKPSAPIPVIVLTARDPELNQQRAAAAGAVAFLQKPPDYEELLSTIRAHIGRVRSPLKKILIIEDDPDTQKGLATLLKAEGFLTNVVWYADAALPVVSRENPNIILLDLGLPGGGGFMVLERLKTHPTLNGIPVIVISASDPEVTKPKVLQAGAEAFFQKPADFEELLKAIRKALGDA
ncbi:MAG: response regulator transcription factor, partial [Acidobacteria bacterium]|nr:response regulator transcription factor [Acidobacteriota bacterium]